MAIIPQISIFDNTENFDKLGDLSRVKLIIENIADGDVLEKLRKDRDYRGRKGAGLEVLINIYWAQKILQHTTISETLRELRRNSQLRKLIGIQNDAVPSNSALTRFMNKLRKNKIDLKQEIFYVQRDVLMELLPDYGNETGADGKYLNSYAKRENKSKKKDGRRDLDAKYGIKKKFYRDKSGAERIKTSVHYGYRNHLLADVKYELPIDYEVTTANINEGKMLDQMLKKARNKRIINRAKSLTADKGYDSGKRINKLEKMGIIPIIDKRMQITEEREILRTVYYDDLGNVSCYCPLTAEKRAMAFNGYDKSRDTLSYKCPVKAYGIKCKRIWNL